MKIFQELILSHKYLPPPYLILSISLVNGINQTTQATN